MSSSTRWSGVFAGGVFLGLLLALTPAAWAVDIPVTGRKLVVVDKTAASGKAKAVLVSKDPLIVKGAGTDPAQFEATLEISYDSAYGAFLMPQGEGWLFNATVLSKYVNRSSPSEGAVKVSVIKPTRLLKVVGKSLGDAPLRIASAPSGPVYVAETIVNGGEETRLCTQFTECVHKVIAGGTGYKLVCTNGVGDPSCEAGRAPLPGCGEAASPECNGVCPAGQTCLSFLSDFCGCAPNIEPFAGACGELVGAPTCLGECPPWAPICADLAGDCTCVASVAPIDNGDGTVTDPKTGLMWEKKDTAVGSGVDAGNLHDVDNEYLWSGMCTISGALCQPNAAAVATCTAQTGGALGCAKCGVGEGTCDVAPVFGAVPTTIWDWVNQMNAESYAGHGDWRVPTSAGVGTLGATGDAPEVDSLLDWGFSPTIDPIFGPTVASNYCSSSTDPIIPTAAYAPNFRSGSVDSIVYKNGYQTGGCNVRAVR